MKLESEENKLTQGWRQFTHLYSQRVQSHELNCQTLYLLINMAQYSKL